jgi:hypothetical protein
MKFLDSRLDIISAVDTSKLPNLSQNAATGDTL